VLIMKIRKSFNPMNQGSDNFRIKYRKTLRHKATRVLVISLSSYVRPAPVRRKILFLHPASAATSLGDWFASVIRCDDKRGLRSIDRECLDCS
jgi:hypothetical protein